MYLIGIIVQGRLSQGSMRNLGEPVDKGIQSEETGDEDKGPAVGSNQMNPHSILWKKGL
jgi:hypothetical protein